MHKKRLMFVLSILVFIFLFGTYFFIITGLPTSFSLIRGNESSIALNFPFNLYVQSQGEAPLEINGQLLGKEQYILDSGNHLTLKGDNIGKVSLNFKLFGFIPIRTVTVNVLPNIKVYPGGQAIGVLMRSQGVMVVGNAYVEGKDGKRHYPAQRAGINVGDTILAVNEQEVNDKNELAKIIQKEAKKASPLYFKIKSASNNIRIVAVEPIINRDGNYMLGLYVDDGVAGVGTLTFYEEETMEYGALGHVITETNSQKKIEIREGKIIEAQISGINTGQRGLPGEKLGTFFQSNNILGNIQQNTEFGIYGILNRALKNPYFAEPIAVAAISEVERGPAKIYTVVKGGKIEEFSIEIERVYRQSSPTGKGMVINITDPELSRVTGGIIQGMSGSPIVQNNKLVGAVTHVFINEPTRGYGVFAEWMFLQTNIYDKKQG